MKQYARLKHPFIIEDTEYITGKVRRILGPGTQPGTTRVRSMSTDPTTGTYFDMDMPTAELEPAAMPTWVRVAHFCRVAVPLGLAAYLIRRNFAVDTTLLHQLAADPVLAWSGRALIAVVMGSLGVATAFKTAAWMAGTAHRAGVDRAERRIRAAREEEDRRRRLAAEDENRQTAERMAVLEAARGMKIEPPAMTAEVKIKGPPQYGDRVRLIRGIGQDTDGTPHRAGTEYSVGSSGNDIVYGVDLVDGGWANPDDLVIVSRKF